jgi:RimJ/RimL family protein N-acetyltransferase
MSALASLFDPAIHIPQMLREMTCANAPKAWSTYLAEIEHRMHDQNFAEGFRELCPVANAESSEYNYRIHSTRDITFVSSIRFEGLSLEKPFVEIPLWSRPLTCEELSLITNVVTSEYSRFKPRRIKYFNPNDRAIHREDKEDFAFFVENTSVIQSGERPLRYDDVELRPAASLDFYPDLIRIYEGLKEESPHALKPEQLPSLEKSMQQGLIYEAFIKGQWAGMMSAQQLTERFYSGVFIVEEALDRQYRGQGYAPAMQRKFIEQLDRDQLVFGEILWWNERSRRTAMRVGRKKCGTTFFHKIE